MENKPQAADMMIRTTVGKVLKDNKYSEIFILSHDKGYRDVVDGKKVIQVKTIEGIQLRKIKNQKCLN